MIPTTRSSQSSNKPLANSNDWYVRPFEARDEDKLLSLYERAFQRPRDRSHLRWKLLKRQAPFTLLWVAAIPGESGQNEQIIGHYAGIPIKIKIGDHIEEAVHAVEAMTDPIFRRRGLLTMLGGTSHSTWTEAGQQLVTGLPNDQWGTRNRALGYLPVFPLSWLRFPLHLERALVRRRSMPAPLRILGYLPFMAASAGWRTAFRFHNTLSNRGTGGTGAVRVQIASETESVFDDIWEYASRDWTNVQVRDNTWVRWRYLQAAPNPYEVAVAWKSDGVDALRPIGYAAYRVIDDGERRNGYLADIFVARDDKASASALITTTLDRLSEMGAGTVMTLAAPGSPLYSILRECGFLPTRSETAFSFEIVPLAPTISVDTLSMPGDWFLTGGDFDVI